MRVAECEPGCVFLGACGSFRLVVVGGEIASALCSAVWLDVFMILKCSRVRI